ncbi:UNVERIFIED_CONTAM: hypothetical protein FKN15_036946 [Acipenser sinensis]
MEQDCQVRKPRPAAQSSDPNVTSPHNHHDLTGSAREEVGRTKENGVDSRHTHQRNTQEKPVMKTEVETSTKLCGYLNKLGGPLKAWKARWFVFEEKKCQLYYYRMSQDANPLGSIDLANATFGYPAEAEEGTFEIQIPGRVVVLKGNICKERTEDFLPAIKTPKGLVGEAAACLPDPWQQNALQKLSLKHPITELQNTVLNICGNKPAQELRRSVFNFDKIQQPLDSPCEDPVTLGETTVPLAPTAPTVLSAPSVSSVTNGPAQEARTGGKNSPSSSMKKREKKMTSSLQPSGEKVSGKEGSPVDKLSRLQHEVFTLTEELKSQKELVQLLHKTLEAAQLEKRTCKQFLAAAGEQERLELVRHKERCIADLDGRLEALLKHKEELEQSLAMRDCQVNELQQHVQLMMEKNNAKQEVILKLSEQVDSCMADPKRTISNTMGTDTFCKLQEKIEHLECAYLEAKNCQIESKYLIVLRSLQDSKGLDSSQQEMVKRLIEDSLQGDVKDVLKLNPVSEYDDYGFKTIPDYEVEDMKLLAKIQALEIRSNNLRSNEMVDKPLRTRWANYLGSRRLGELAPSPELKGLIRLAALALLVLKDEEDAFWCLVAVVEIIMPQDYYSKTLTASQADQRVFRDFLAEKMPRLTAHFKEHSIDHSLITFNWFLVVFVESLVSDILLRVWDAFLYEGTKLLKNRREFHMERLTAELQELERIQEEFVKEQQVERKDKDLDTAVSEDEEEINCSQLAITHH